MESECETNQVDITHQLRLFENYSFSFNIFYLLFLYLRLLKESAVINVVKFFTVLLRYFLNLMKSNN